MMRNDYRRALILLRSNAAGCSGHVRLERRTLTGSMFFQLQAPSERTDLRASLAGRDKNEYYACSLGQMQRDSRGQAVLSYSFDPRNICGRELERYQLIVISSGEGEGCDLLLYGNVAGHADVNWEGIREAVCGLYTGAGGEEKKEQEELAGMLPEADNSMMLPPEEIQKEIQEDISPEPPASEPEPQTAGEILNMDMNLPWSQGIEPLRPLFNLSVPMENPPDEEYIYIAAAMPEDSGYSYCAVGILARNGAPVSVRYGLPAAWTPEPPAGLEEYSWVGDHNRGWWMTQIEVNN